MNDVLLDVSATAVSLNEEQLVSSSSSSYAGDIIVVKCVCAIQVHFLFPHSYNPI